ncbi:hypothetical protein [Stieleria varia]|uniref:Uncharacterized protein n=1 Tax=Stieleria varia TaxID=2528005 RepID=A0A5C6AX54_9BACT|nr:hypothetical protein [Stieleria varia]TWU04585.1 hypothetical protein Pla52n_26270 [Stieleria varia]
MKRSLSICTLFLTACLLSFVGCKEGTPKSATTASSPEAPAENTQGEHVPADGTKHVDDTEHASHDGHGAEGHGTEGHGTEGHGTGPHDGTVADWGGGKYHVEFTVDHDKQEGTVYILGADEKSPVPIDAESIDLSISDPVMQVTLMASPQDGDPEGKASRFVGNHEKLGVVQEYAGTIAGVIDGTPYSGDFKEVAHGHHD